MELLLSLISTKILAAAPIVGTIDNPLLAPSYGDITGLGLFISNILRLFFVVAGILALFNFMISGFQYMSSAGDPKALQQAWNRISLSLVGLVIMVGSFVLAAIFGQLIFGDPTFMLSPVIYGPK
jgi:hypothetical protein